MIRKSRFGLIRALATTAKQANFPLNKNDERLSYIVNSHQYFIWDNEEAVTDFILLNLQKLNNRKQKRR